MTDQPPSLKCEPGEYMIIEAFDRNGNRIWKGRTTNTATVPELHGQDIGHFEGRVYKDEDND